MTVTGPKAEADKIAGLDVLVEPGNTVTIGETLLDVLFAPGHTLGHIVFHDPAGHHVFTGDALFSMGCGRMFEGTPEPMWAGLERLRALPGETMIYCGHEYTKANAKFALQPRARTTLRSRSAQRRSTSFAQHDKLTIPVNMATELAHQSLPPRRHARAAGGDEPPRWPRVRGFRGHPEGQGHLPMRRRPKLTFKPVTKSTKDDFVALFEARADRNTAGAWPGGPPRKKAEAYAGSKRKPLMLNRIDAGVPVGLVGYLDGEPVAWVVDRAEGNFPAGLGGPEPQEGEKVWSLVCMFMRRKSRGEGSATS